MSGTECEPIGESAGSVLTLPKTTKLREPREMLMTDRPLEDKRKDIFRALVELQDNGCATQPSRIQIADQFGISIAEIQHVEREGIAKKWPPLADDSP